MICTVKPLSVIWLNSHTQEHMKLCSKQKGQLFSLHLRIKHEEDEQNRSSTLNTRIIVPPCHIFTCAFWPLWGVYAVCHMGTYFGTFYFKNCLRMPTQSSTVPSLSIPADPSQDNLNCTVACLKKLHAAQSALSWEDKTKQIPISHQCSLTKDTTSSFPKWLFFHVYLVLLVCIGRNHHYEY